MSETIVDKDEFDRYAEQLVSREVYEPGQLELEDEDDYWLVVNSTGQLTE